MVLNTFILREIIYYCSDSFLSPISCLALPIRAVQATISAYASTSCQESKLQQREYFGLGCAVSVLDSYAQDAVPYSTSLMCSERGSSSGSSGSSSGSGDLAPPVPVASVAKDYVLQR